MVENAVPTMTVRPSRLRAPATVSATAARAAASAVSPTHLKWTCPPNMTWLWATACIQTSGAAAMARPITSARTMCREVLRRIQN